MHPKISVHRYISEISYSCSELYQKVAVIGLNLCLVSRFVAHGSTASVASVHDDESALCIGESLHGAENTAAIVSSVTGIYINVKRAEAERTVIS